MNILAFGNGSLSLAQQERRLSLEFAKLGHTVHLLINEDNRMFKTGDIDEHENLHIHYLPFGNYRFDFIPVDDKIDVAFGMDQSVIPFVVEYKKRTGVRSYCLMLDIPVHVIDSGQPQYDFNFSQKFYYYLMCSLELDGTIFINNVACEEYYKRYKREGHVVYYAVTNDDAYDKYAGTSDWEDWQSDRGQFASGLNRIISWKGIHHVMDALSYVKYDYLHGFMNGDKKYMEEVFAKAEKLPQDILFIEKPGEIEKMRLLYKSDVVVYAQTCEWMGGLPIIEGWSVGTPGVCFDYPLMRELYGDGALYAKPGDPISLADKIRSLMEDKEMNTEIARIGNERFKKHFTRKVMAEKLLEVIE